MTSPIYVFGDWVGLNGPVFIGVLHSRRSPGKELFEFQFNSSALARDAIRNTYLDPHLSSRPGAHYPPKELATFGVFSDASPDRWGRLLIKRRHTELIRTGKLPAGTKLFESDYLLGVHDLYRVGGLRFKTSMEGAFLNDDDKMAAPPVAKIAELERAAAALEKGDDKNVSKWLKLLVAPGGSLGGARPKASVVDTTGHLCIAKFPSINDTYDMGAWEAVVNALAHTAELNVASGRTAKFASRQHTFIVKRFDRNASGKRFHFASALTMLGKSDGYDASEGASYIEIAEWLMRHGGNVDNDLQELWSRIVFNMLVSNVDDHMRNHGFLLDPHEGWCLSPAYDINPVSDAAGLTLNINEAENTLDLDLALSVADIFRLKLDEAKAIIEFQKNIVSQWRSIADALGISRSEQEEMQAAFRLAE